MKWQDRFWDFVEVGIEGCWPWRGTIDHYGYGAFSRNNKWLKAHRVMMEVSGDPVPENLTIDHLCRNRSCVRPSHMEAVTRGENVRRGEHPSQVAHRNGTCERGHTNVYLGASGKTRCRDCRNDYKRIRKLAGLAFALALFCHAQVTPKPLPKGPHANGYWQVQPGIYVPCNAIKPFLPFVNTPGDGNTYYLGGDVNANIPHPNLYGQYIDAIYYNHTHAFYDHQGFITPMYRENGPGNWYPAPDTNAQLCTQWAGFSGNTATCPSGDNTHYTNVFMSNEVWQLSYQVYLPQIQADCNGTQPTSTPTRTATSNFTPTPTPTPGPNQFAHYVEWAAQVHITAGCGGGNYCPGNPVNRDSMAAFLFNLATWVQTHPGAVPVLPPCATPQAFNDVVCK